MHSAWVYLDVHLFGFLAGTFRQSCSEKSVQMNFSGLASSLQHRSSPNQAGKLKNHGKVAMKSLFSRSEKLFACAVAVVFLFSAVWGIWLEPDSNPLPGFRAVSKNLWAAWPASALSVYIAFVVTVLRKSSAASLLFLSGFTACAFLTLAAFVSSGAAICLAFLSSMLYRKAEGTL